MTWQTNLKIEESSTKNEQKNRWTECVHVDLQPFMEFLFNVYIMGER